jgi:hypothetical protein
MVIGLREYRNDPDLTSAIRYQLTEHRRQETPAGPSATTVVAALRRKQDKLLELHFADQIDGDTFATKNRLLVTQIVALEDEDKRRQKDLETREHAADRFDEVASLLATTDFEQILKVATEPERRVLVEDLIDSVCIYPDQITVQVAGAPPILVTLDEAGLTQGCKPVASEARREPSLTLHGIEVNSGGRRLSRNQASKVASPSRDVSFWVDTLSDNRRVERKDSRWCYQSRGSRARVLPSARRPS